MGELDWLWGVNSLRIGLDISLFCLGKNKNKQKNNPKRCLVFLRHDNLVTATTLVLFPISSDSTCCWQGRSHFLISSDLQMWGYFCSKKAFHPTKTNWRNSNFIQWSKKKKRVFFFHLFLGEKDLLLFWHRNILAAEIPSNTAKHNKKKTDRPTNWFTQLFQEGCGDKRFPKHFAI